MWIYVFLPNPVEVTDAQCQKLYPDVLLSSAVIWPADAKQINQSWKDYINTAQLSELGSVLFAQFCTVYQGNNNLSSVEIHCTLQFTALYFPKPICNKRTRQHTTPN